MLGALKFHASRVEFTRPQKQGCKHPLAFLENNQLCALKRPFRRWRDLC